MFSMLFLYYFPKTLAARRIKRLRVSERGSLNHFFINQHLLKNIPKKAVI